MRRTAFLFDEHCFWHSAGQYALTLPVGRWVQPSASGGFAESPESKRRLKNLLDVSGLTARLLAGGAEPATDEDLMRVHPSTHLKKFRALSDAGHGLLGPEAPVGPGSYEIAKRSAGLAIAAVDKVLRHEADNAYALCRPPGHHARPEEGMGFCYFANIAVAIETARERHGVERVAVVDWDVHHGNGTQEIFYRRPDVLTISLHQEKCFPLGYTGETDRGEGPGEGFNLNIPLVAGSGHDTYLDALRRLVVPALDHYQPELIIVACGFDAGALDPLARMLLHSDSYRAMTALLVETAARLCGGRLVLVHEGGYSEAYVPFCGLATIEALCGHRTAVEDLLLPELVAQQPGEDFLAFQKNRLDRLVRHFGL